MIAIKIKRVPCSRSCVKLCAHTVMFNLPNGLFCPAGTEALNSSVTCPWFCMHYVLECQLSETV
jgi:hypothetical protein